MYGIDLSLGSLFVAMLCCYRRASWYLWNGLKAMLEFFRSNLAFALSQRCFAFIEAFASLASGLLRALSYPYARFGETEEMNNSYVFSLHRIDIVSR